MGCRHGPKPCGPVRGGSRLIVTLPLNEVRRRAALAHPFWGWSLRQGLYLRTFCKGLWNQRFRSGIPASLFAIRAFWEIG